MIRLENTEVFNFGGAIRGARNSWESWEKSDSEWHENRTYMIGPNDLALMKKLVKAGPDHGKFLRQILVSVDVIAPDYFFKEFSTYKVGTVENSTSLMHTLGKDYTPVDAFSFEDVDDDLKNDYVEILHESQRRWYESGKKKPSREWRQMNQLVSMAFNYRRTVTLNYQVLRNMYHSRRNHRLSEWHDFCDWIKDLPYSELITE